MRVRHFAAAMSFAALIPLLSRADTASLAERRSAQAFGITDENDWWGAWSDKYYTNGTRFAWTTPDWFSNEGDGVIRRATISLTQQMYTPKNTAAVTPPAGDHPYAGLTYVGAGFSWETDGYLDSVELDLGIMGPGALARQTQQGWHVFLHDTQPQGWSTQFHDEPIVNLTLERRWRFLLAGEPSGWSVDVLPRVVGIGGTMRTEAVAGAQFRFGVNLPRDFGRATIRQNTAYVAPHTERDWSVYGFLDIQAEAIAYDASLDGGLWHDSPYDTNSKPFVGQLSAGIGFRVDRFNVSLVQSVRTEEFKGQDHVFAFGGIVGSVDF